MIGRELDLFIARHVMNLSEDEIFLPITTDPLYEPDHLSKRSLRCMLKHYSTDITTAWEVVGKMSKEGFYFKIFTLNNCVQIFNKKTEFSLIFGETIPEAICQAALKAYLGK